MCWSQGSNTAQLVPGTTSCSMTPVSSLLASVKWWIGVELLRCLCVNSSLFLLSHFNLVNKSTFQLLGKYTVEITNDEYKCIINMISTQFTLRGNTYTNNFQITMVMQHLLIGRFSQLSSISPRLTCLCLCNHRWYVCADESNMSYCMCVYA